MTATSRTRILATIAAAMMALALAAPPADAAVAAANCQFTGVLSAGGATAVLEGQATGGPTAASTTILCQLRQGSTVVLSAGTSLPGPVAVAAATGTIPLQTTNVCARVIVRDINTSEYDSGWNCSGSLGGLAGSATAL